MSSATTNGNAIGPGGPSSSGRPGAVRAQTAIELAYRGSLNLCPNPVFVVGAPRSGTTALGRALANHSDFWASEETHILYWVFGNERVITEFQRWKTQRRSPTWLRDQDVELAEFLAYVGLGINALFTDRSWGKRWIDHTPYYALMIDVLAQMFPGARFIHILRDGRAVVNSMVNVAVTLPEDEREEMSAGEFLPPWSNDFSEACKTWRDCVMEALKASDRYPERCLTIRHDQITDHPEKAFRAILK